MKRASGARGLLAGALVAALLTGAGTARAATVPHGVSLRRVDLHSLYTRLLARETRRRVAYALARGREAARPQAGSASCSETSPPSDCPLVYQGGEVQTAPRLYLLLWGPQWSPTGADAVYLTDFLSGLGVEPKDTWSTTMYQYGGSNGRPTFAGDVLQGVFQDLSTPPSGATQSQLAAEADAFYANQGITSGVNTQIIVATQSGTCPQGFYAPSCFGGSGTYCAWHSDTSVYGVPFTNLPYLPDAGGACGEGLVNSPGTYDGFSIVEGHEFAETVTDPSVGTGWIDTSDPSGGEIGDKCAWVSNTGDVAFSTGSFPVQPLFSNQALGDGLDGCVQSSPMVTVKRYSPNKGTGTVTSSTAGGIACGSTCSWAFPATLGRITLDEVPAGGTVFTGWGPSTNPCRSADESPSCEVSLGGQAVTVNADFTGSAKLYQQGAASRSGTWYAGKCLCYSGGTDVYTKSRGASATFRFTGNRVQFVSEKSPKRGSFKVYVDGRYLKTVSEHSSTSQNAVVVFTKRFATVGTHTLKIVNLASAGHPRVDVDAFVVSS